MLTNFQIFEKKPDHNFFYGLILGHFQKSPSTFGNLTFINVRNRKPVPDFWEFFCVLEYILKQLKESKNLFFTLKIILYFIYHDR
jgi:hypothetical protein